MRPLAAQHIDLLVIGPLGHALAEQSHPPSNVGQTLANLTLYYGAIGDRVDLGLRWWRRRGISRSAMGAEHLPKDAIPGWHQMLYCNITYRKWLSDRAALVYRLQPAKPKTIAILCHEQSLRREPQQRFSWCHSTHTQEPLGLAKCYVR